MMVQFKEFLNSRAGSIVIHLLRIGLGLLFVYASLDKIWHPGLFAKAISNYRLLPLPLLQLSAIILPWLELTCGVALILNRYHRAANLVIGSLLLIFILAILSAMARGLDFNCGCFGVSSEETNIGFWKVAQNMGLLFSSIILEFRFQNEKQGS
ncbi:MAG: DoxX family membrane protein [Candidatus Marinimicrobia bacterium]|nr:DoxX family membrane protein [Candidatus Neomarinimicrobiota bacterium]